MKAVKPAPTTAEDIPGARYAGTRRLGFESMQEELHVERLPILGALPAWLTGTLVRATPALFEIGGKSTRHWFDGLAMLNGFSIADGRVSYGSRFLETRAYKNARQGKEAYIGFANDPCRSLFKRAMALFEPTVNDNCNVNVAQLGDRYVAMTEMPVPIQFDRQTLGTLGSVKWKKESGGVVSSAHPHFDQQRGELINYVTHVGLRGVSYRIFAARDVQTKRQIGSIPASKLSYVHSFSMTERYIIFAEFPLTLDIRRFLIEYALHPRPIAHHLHWEPERGTRFYVLDRQTGKLKKTIETDGFFAFHHVNAFERAGELVIDIVVHEDGPRAIRLLELERAREPSSSIASQAYLHRYRIPLKGTLVRDERLCDVPMELPRINYDHFNAREYRHVYASGQRSQDSDWLDQLVKINVNDGSLKRWEEDGCYPGEPVFVSAPGASSEDDGVILSVVLDSRSGRSFMLVLKASTFEELARAEVPHHIPFGFHGNFFEGGVNPVDGVAGTT